MGIRRKASILMGAAQSVVGAFAVAFAYLLYYNFRELQAVLNVPAQDTTLYMLILIVFGLLSIISGLFLLNEQE